MKALIVEDEAAASRRLIRMLGSKATDIEVIDVLETISDTVSWLTVHQHPEVIFCDIHLADGSCFNIFRQVRVKCPVIFITAYDQYAIEAFKVNSIDYLLKPVKSDELSGSIQKLRELSGHNNLDALIALLSKTKPDYHARFVIKNGPYIKAIEASQVAVFYAEEGGVFLLTHDGQRMVTDLTLDKVMLLVDPRRFFRINRGQIVSIDAISKMYVHTKGRVKIELRVKTTFESLVSSERGSTFKSWLSGDTSNV